jgi:hypothetical protein
MFGIEDGQGPFAAGADDQGAVADAPLPRWNAPRGIGILVIVISCVGSAAATVRRTGSTGCLEPE